MMQLRAEKIYVLWPDSQQYVEHIRMPKSIYRLASGTMLQRNLDDAETQYIPAWPQPKAEDQQSTEISL